MNFSSSKLTSPIFQTKSMKKVLWLYIKKFWGNDLSPIKIIFLMWVSSQSIVKTLPRSEIWSSYNLIVSLWVAEQVLGTCYSFLLVYKHFFPILIWAEVLEELSFKFFSTIESLLYSQISFQSLKMHLHLKNESFSLFIFLFSEKVSFVGHKNPLLLFIMNQMIFCLNLGYFHLIS